jgi:hypothetical protein
MTVVPDVQAVKQDALPDAGTARSKPPKRGKLAAGGGAGPGLRIGGSIPSFRLFAARGKAPAISSHPVNRANVRARAAGGESAR